MVKNLFTRLKLPLGHDMKYVQKMVKLSSRPIALIDDGTSDSALRPVSYTHLDVYKRQGLNLKMNLKLS